MGLVVEPGDLIQVFINDGETAGHCLWGKIQPVTLPKGGMCLVVETEPLPDTVEHCERAGVKVHRTSAAVTLTRGAMVTIPKEAIDVVFGDDRHFANHG